MPQAPFFNAFKEPATWQKASGDVLIEIIPDFNLDLEQIYGEQMPTGYVGIFEVMKEVFEQVTTGEKILYEGKHFEVIYKEAFPKNKGYKLQVEA